jgi:hypothetical protein
MRKLTVAVLILIAASVQAIPADFETFLNTVDRAQDQLLNGKPGPFRDLWLRSDEVTLSGGFGGKIEKGWAAVAERLDWVALRYSHGRAKRQRIAYGVADRMAYVVQTEQIVYRVPGESTESSRDYRVTMIFRLEDETWKMVHRQADTNVQKEAGK